MKLLPARSRTAGFTLVEVLVALVITSLLVSILMGMLYYVYRVQDALREEIVEREFQLRTRAWFSEILASCLAAEAGTKMAFEGSSKKISCDTLSPLRPQTTLAPRRITLMLRQSSTGTNELTYAEQGDSEDQGHSLIILPAGEASFFFSGMDQVEKSSWQPGDSTAETIPRRIRLAVTNSSEIVFEWLATPLADPWLEPAFKNPFGLELPR